MSFEQQPMTGEQIENEVARTINSAEPDEDIYPIEIEVDSWPGGREVEIFHENGDWESATYLG